MTTDTGTAIADLLASGGVRRFYTVPGESFLEILDGVDRDPRLTLVSTRHEGGASFMADADAKVSGVPAVVAATRGVGAANLAIGVHTAYQDSTPMVVLLGQVDSRFLGREGFQEVDLPAFYAPITKSAVTVHRTERIPELVADAMRIATTGRPGPTMIAFPADVLAHSIDDAAVALGRRRVAAERTAPSADPAAIGQLAAKLAAAERPVIIAGGGTRDARRELQEVAEAYGAGVYVAFRRQDAFDNSHPQFLGHLGLGLPPNVLAAVREADLVLVVGTRLSENTTQAYTLPAESSEVCQIDIDPRVIGAIAPVSLGIVSAARSALQALLDRPEAGGSRGRDWSVAHAAYEATATVGASRATTGCDPARVYGAIAQAFPDDAILSTDAGNFSAYMHRFWSFTSASSQIGPTSGAMGYGVPGAIVAKFAAPGRSVIGLAGDGGFMMSGAELETAVRFGLDLTVVVFRNGVYGTIAMHQARELGRLSGVDIGPIDCASFARSLGASAVTVREESELADAMAEAAKPGLGPHVVEVLTDPDLITPTARLSELLASHESAS
jgi:acetolactate synthase-1/2/3 large subunit